MPVARRAWSLVLVSCLLALLVIPQCAATPQAVGEYALRALVPAPNPDSTTTTGTGTSSTPTSTTTTTTTTTTSSSPSTTTTSSPSSTTTTPTTTSAPPTSTPPTSNPPLTGPSDTGTSNSATGTSAGASQPTGNTSNNSSVGPGTIIGMSVAGGIAGVGIIGFIIWKLTRKRMGDFDDNEEIKWPDLNAHGGVATHALPVKSTGRSGFGDNESEVDAPRSLGPSSVDLHGSVGDPYAVPPLPHLNPNQPYRDDPGAAYYDPYRGPVPHSFNDPASAVDLQAPGGGWNQGEAIPMTQMRGKSPGPGMYDNGGRSSPAPGMRSPAPPAAYGYPDQRMASPAPPGFQPPGRIGSPGPGRMGSPAPPMARQASPGPQAAYGQYPQY